VPDLSSLAQPLIEHPPRPAPPVDRLRRRIARRRRRRVFVAGAVIAAGALLFVGVRDDPVRVVTTGPASPSSEVVDLSVLQQFHPVGPVTVVDEGVTDGSPWQLVVFIGSTDDGAGRSGTGPCSLLLEARPGAPLPAGAGGCSSDGKGHDGPNAGATGYGFARVGTTTFVTGEAGNTVERVRIQLRGGDHVEAVTHSAENIDGRYWVVALPPDDTSGDWLARANEAVTAVVPLQSGPGETIPQGDRGNYGLVVSNQSSGVPSVYLTVRIDGRSAVQGRFDVGNHHNFVPFQLEVEDGSHRLTAEATDFAGNHLASLERAIDVTGRPFGLVTFWTEAGRHELHLDEQSKPFAFG
jgi:hypothetical protein